MRGAAFVVVLFGDAAQEAQELPTLPGGERGEYPLLRRGDGGLGPVQEGAAGLGAGDGGGGAARD